MGGEARVGDLEGRVDRWRCVALFASGALAAAATVITALGVAAVVDAKEKRGAKIPAAAPTPDATKVKKGWFM